MRKSEQGLVGKGRFVAEKGTVGADKFIWTLVPTPDFRLCLWTCVISYVSSMRLIRACIQLAKRAFMQFHGFASMK